MLNIISEYLCLRKHYTEVSIYPSSCTAAAGVFVHCCSGLLSPICCYSLAWKQDWERFHTYTHWPLINKSDQGPFPHIHSTQMTTKTIHTHTASNHGNIPERILLDLDHTWCLWGSDLATQVFVCQIWQPDVSIAFYFKRRLSPRGTVSKHKEICSHQLFSVFCLHGMNWQVLLWEFAV